jgi:hypothetical protein
MYNHYFFLALDTARERAAEADRYRLAALSRSGATTTSPARRLIARAAIAVARAADRTTLDHIPSAS